MDGWDWVWGTLMMVLFWGVVVAVIVFVLRAFGDRTSRDPDETPEPDARTILENRFARSEISQEEFEQKTRVLEGRQRR